MREFRLYFAQKSVKIALSLLLIVVGIGYAFFDTFTYLPYFFIISGIIAVVIYFKSLNNRSFYVILFLLYFVPISMQHETYKRYSVNITLLENQTKTFFIVSIPALKWTDFASTWFHWGDIQVDFKDKSIVNLHRGLPNYLQFDDEYIYKKGYSLSIINGKNGEYEYIVLSPLVKMVNRQHEEKLDVNDYNKLSFDDAELNREERQRKVDSLEKSHGLQ